MKIMVNLNENFIDVWNEEKEIWERYVKVDLVSEQQNKIPEKLSTWFALEENCENDNIQYANNNFKTMYEKINEICGYLKSKGE